MPELTKQQQSAVEDRGGALLVSAAAGSGKTKVLVERLFRYVTVEGRNIDDFLIITYTRAAAAELRGKIAAELSLRMAADPGNTHLRRQLLRVYRTDIKTVDAFCVTLLRENTHLLSREGDEHALTPDFRVLDESEALLLQNKVLDRVLESFYENLTDGGTLLADTLGAGRDDRNLAELVLKFYEKLQSHADPCAFLKKNRESWERLPENFNDTPYARSLLKIIRERGTLWADKLRQGAGWTQSDSKLFSGYGKKFLTAAGGFDALINADSWDEARNAAQSIVFPRLYTPKDYDWNSDIPVLKTIYQGAKDALGKINDWLSVSGQEAMEDLRAMAPAMTALLDLTAAFSDAFRAEKLRINAVDFSDQEHLALFLLVKPDGTPTELGLQTAANYTEILVDEYQDTNEVQNAIFQAVSKEGKNLFVVGDVKQSIYRFRLADPTIFLNKLNRFKPREEAREGEERKIVLSKNFRSRQEILDTANFVFENILSVKMGEMEYDQDAALHFGADYYPPRTDCNTEFHLITAVQKSEENQRPVKKLTAEARFVAQRIRQLLDEGYPVTTPAGTLRPCTPEDIVILMRSPGSRASAFAAALAERDIPCSFQEDSGFFQTMEVSTVVSMLDLMDNPRQDVPLIAVLRSPVFGFTPDRLAEIRAQCPNGDFYDAVSSDPGGDCKAFLQILDELRLAARDMDLHRLMWHLYNTLNLPGIFGAMDRGLERRENLIALTRQAEKFEQNGCRGLFAFVTRLRRLLEANKAPESGSVGAVNGVRLMTIHKSKGLEFPIVILADLDHRFSRMDFETPVLVHPEMGLGPQRVDLARKIRFPTLARLAVEETIRRENLAEEQRVLYVAMTRPKEKLILVNSLYFAETRLRRLAANASCPAEPESVADCKNFGEWIMLALLCRPEAQELRDLAWKSDRDLSLVNGGAPWIVVVHDSESFRDAPSLAALAEEAVRAEPDFDPALLSYVCPPESGLPAKLTATQLKGRLLDDEISKDAAHTPYLRPLSQPKFRRESKGLTPAERGTATHLALQFLNFHDLDAKQQVSDMTAAGKLTEEQAGAVDIKALEGFLNSSLADEIRKAEQVLREYRFTLLVSAQEYAPAAPKDDFILLQGVADCCFYSPDGLTIVDFKTDHVYHYDDINTRAEHYRPQLNAYSLALSRVLQRPVHRKILYFLSPGKMIEV